ncbi:hypothetical protein [Amycolatopsis sp. NPDC004079]|uniref:hypothetical protein n=1 Tax=Amycolatopsis sp. NPDC004079 TaxID=3154549 RepID=UPI0033AD1427
MNLEDAAERKAGATGDRRPTMLCHSARALPLLPSNARTCAECGTGIWVSMSMTPRVDRGEIRPLCPLCMRRVMDSASDMEFEIPSEQASELAAVGALGAADQLVAALNAKYRTGPRFYCPKCGRVSSHPKDVAEGYCWHCHDWTGRRGEGREGFNG